MRSYLACVLILGCGGDPASVVPDAPGLAAHELGLYAPSLDLVRLHTGETELTFIHGVTRLAYSVRVPLVGDFDGDGFDSIATYDIRSHELFIKHTNDTSPDDTIRTLGTGTEYPIAGDFDGDGVDSVGLYTPATATFDLDGTKFVFGPLQGAPFAGDFDGDGVDTVGVLDRASASLMFLVEANRAGAPDRTLAVTGAIAGTLPFAGDLDGDGLDDAGFFDTTTTTFRWASSAAGGTLDQLQIAPLPAPAFPLVGRWQLATPTPVREGHAWIRATPAEVAIDPAALANAYTFARTLPGIHSVLVARQGKLAAEEYLNGFTAATPQCIKSVSKSILSLLYGAASSDGLVAMDLRLVDHFPSLAAGGTADPRRRDIVVGHMLTMTAGIDWTENDNTFWPAFLTAADPVGYVTSQPMISTPGATFHYSTGLTLLAAHMLEDRTPGTLLEWARSRVFSRIGIDIQRWDRDASNYYFGGTEMFMPPRDLARFGELYLRQGLLDGDQVVPATWITTSTTPFRDGYGAYWWTRTSNGHPVVFAWGFGGQMVFLVRDLDLVVVVTHAWDVTPAIAEANANRAFSLLDQIVAAAD